MSRDESRLDFLPRDRDRDRRDDLPRDLERECRDDFPRERDRREDFPQERDRRDDFPRDFDREDRDFFRSLDRDRERRSFLLGKKLICNKRIIKNFPINTVSKHF